MKRLLSTIMVCVLLVAMFTASVFADSTQSEDIPELPEFQSYARHHATLRGTGIPSTTVPLYAGVYSTGMGTFSYGVYSNNKYSDHGGSITIEYTNTNQYPLSTQPMSICLYTGNNIFTQTYVDSFTCTVNSSGTHTFTGLNTNKTYYFWFVQGNYEFDTTISFTVTRGN